MRLIFMGTPDFSVPALGEILSQGHDVAAVYTQPPRPAGRGMAERRSAVHDFAAAHGLEVRHPASLKGEDEQTAFTALGADAAVVVAYGLILPRAVLDAAAGRCFNIHASLLPRWRGAAPIQRAIMAGDAETGVSIMRMAEGLDTGPVCLAERVAINARTTAGDLHDRLSNLGADLMARALAALSRDTLDCTPQSAAGVTYAHKIAKAEARLDLSRSAIETLQTINGLSPSPGAWIKLGPAENAPRLKLLRAELSPLSGEPGRLLDDRLTIACGTGSIHPTLVQREGKMPMETANFLLGTRLTAGATIA